MPTQLPANGPGSIVVSQDEPVSSPTVDAVIVCVSGQPARHTFVADCFGTGKSYALGRAVEVALSSGLRVAALERGALGISSYADFLVADPKATRPSDRSRFEVDGWRQELGDDESGLDLDDPKRGILPGAREPGLVIVIESVDQLLYQFRSTDRPRTVELLTRPVAGSLVLGTVHGMGLADELGESVNLVRATYLPTFEAGSRLSLQETRRLGADDVRLTSRRPLEASSLDHAVRTIWLFWSLVGLYLVIACSDPLRWAEEDLRSRAAGHFDAMLLTLVPSEQRILLAFADAGGPRTVSELADTIGLRNQAPATAFGRLHAEDWVRIAQRPSESDRRRTWYDIAAPAAAPASGGRCRVRISLPSRVKSPNDVLRWGALMPQDLDSAVEWVGSMLDALFPGLVERISSAPAFEIRMATHDGSARTMVFVVPTVGEEFIVRTNAWVLSGPEVSLQLCADLLRRNASVELGAYYLSDEEHVGFAHSILGSTLDLNELQASVVAVASVADRDDDDLQRQYGGSRAIDLPPTA